MAAEKLTHSFGICTARKTVESLNYEKHSLFIAASRVFNRVMLIDTRAVTYQFIRGLDQPIVKHNGEDISDLSFLNVRSTKKREASTAILVRALSKCGCEISDPIKRFSVGYASKLLTTVSRFSKHVGTTSLIGFSEENTLDMVSQIDLSMFPLIAKPISGKQGKGLVKLLDPDEAAQYTQNFFVMQEHPDIPILFQTYVKFVEEYRVMILDGEILGVVRKIAKDGKVQANAAQGGQFVKSNNEMLEDFVKENVSEQGLLGVDVAIDSEKQVHIIETNRAPQWKVFEQATRMDVAREIIMRVHQKALNSPPNPLV